MSEGLPIINGPCVAERDDRKPPRTARSRVWFEPHGEPRRIVAWGTDLSGVISVARVIADVDTVLGRDVSARRVWGYAGVITWEPI